MSRETVRSATLKPELQELPMDSWSAPEWVGTRHSGDQRLELGIDGRATSDGPSRELGPVLAKATTLPPQDGVGRHDDESLSPADPDSGQADPQQAISRAQLRPGHRSLVHGKLLAEGEVLEGELTMAAEEEGEDPKQVEQEGNHRAESVAGSRPADQPLTRRRFWRRTGAMKTRRPSGSRGSRGSAGGDLSGADRVKLAEDLLHPRLFRRAGRRPPPS
jgi:hypothetical protein